MEQVTVGAHRRRQRALDGQPLGELVYELTSLFDISQPRLAAPDHRDGTAVDVALLQEASARGPGGQRATLVS